MQQFTRGTEVFVWSVLIMENTRGTQMSEM